MMRRRKGKASEVGEHEVNIEKRKEGHTAAAVNRSARDGRNHPVDSASGESGCVEATQEENHLDCVSLALMRSELRGS